MPLTPPHLGGAVVLVTGFGPFGTVTDNPAARLAREVDGRRVAGETVVGCVIPVSYARGPARTLELVALLEPALVLGLGVAASRARPEVEAVGRALADPGVPDVDGVALATLHGPPTVAATVDVAVLAAAMDAGRSTDAGRYVCNAWLYRVAAALRVPVGFVHLPPQGMEPARLLQGIAALRLGSAATGGSVPPRPRRARRPGSSTARFPRARSPG